jgi:peptidyl-prolyl cis-trans isomerase SurA
LPLAEAEETVIDTVVASVDNEAITLSDLSSLMSIEVTTDKLTKDESTKKALEALINRSVVESEAQKENISVTEEEIASQINALAVRNNLSLAQFKTALTAEGQKLEDIRKEIRYQILRSRVVARQVKASTVISPSDIKNYVEEAKKNQALAAAQSSNDDRVRFSYISFARTDENAEQKALKVAELLKQSVPFHDVVTAYGDGAQFGVDQSLSEEDLQESLRTALSFLKAGKSSDPVETDQGFLVVQLHSRGKVEIKSDKELKEEARMALEGKNIEEKAQSFLTQELPKKHIIERAPGLEATE